MCSPDLTGDADLIGEGDLLESRFETKRGDHYEVCRALELCIADLLRIAPL